MTRAERRHRWERTKQRYFKLWQQWHQPNPHGKIYRGWTSATGYRWYTAKEFAASVAHLAETHGRPCSCWMCQRDRGIPSQRERAFMDIDSDVV